MPKRFALAASLSLMTVAFGCTNSPGGHEPAVVPADAGPIDPCAGSIANVAPSYVLSTAVGASGGFTVDSKGMVLGLAPDAHHASDVGALPYLIQTASLDGLASTVYTYPAHTVMASVRSDATSIYFFAEAGGAGGVLYEMPRAGGAAVPLYTPTAGTIGSFVLDDTNVYVLVDDALFEVSKSGGEAKSLLAAVDSVTRSNLMISQGTLYWGEKAADSSAESTWR